MKQQTPAIPVPRAQSDVTASKSQVDLTHAPPTQANPLAQAG
jgi:hypothetical protein